MSSQIEQFTIYEWNQSLWQNLNKQQARQNHALLLHGKQGLGKRAFALAMAIKKMGFNADIDPTSVDPLLIAGNHPDLHIISPEEAHTMSDSQNSLYTLYANRYFPANKEKPKTVITVDQIRLLKQSLQTHTHLSQTRVVLIEHANKMNINAANAILKSLEEPPSDTVFILISDELSQIPATIRSRCSLYRFDNPSYAQALKWLTQYTQIEEGKAKSYLSLSGNQPLLALQYYQTDFLEQLKLIFNHANALWSGKISYIEVAKQWQEIGGARSVEVIQKMLIDLIRYLFYSDKTIKQNDFFFPVQSSWLKKISTQLIKHRLFLLYEELIEAKKQLLTPADELLILEQISSKMSQLPNHS